jgi:DNA-binding MarR family transcriptional regulator
MADSNAASTAAELLELVACLGRLLTGDARRRAGTLDLQPVHLQALLYLRDANRYSNTPQALAEYLGSTKGTVSQSLLLLYRKGLIERQADERDGRIVRLKLSAAGASLLREGASARQWRSALGTAQEDEIASAVRVLAGVLTELQRQRGGRSFGVCSTCAHFRCEGARSFRCGLTSEALSVADSRRICREHAIPAEIPTRAAPRG